MRITYISHASYWVDSHTGKTRILLDPWLQGSTYMDQAWHAWTYPGPLDDVARPDYLLFTHYHKDHFHPPSLETVSRRAEAIIPTTPAGFFKERVRELGFANVHEISPNAPLKLGDFEVHAVRIHDHWEFLDETAYLLVEGDQAALFMADLWYLPEPLLRRVCNEFHVRFATIPWGGSLQDLCMLPEGFRLDSLEEFHSYGRDEAILSQRNATQEYEGYLWLAKLLDADVLTPASFGFGWIQSESDRVLPLPINNWLNQEQFVQGIPDSATRSKSHAMYPGDQFDLEKGFQRYQGSSMPNTDVTEIMRSLSMSRRSTCMQLDGEFISYNFLKKIQRRIAQLQNSSEFHRDRLSYVLKTSRQAEFQIVNESKQVFLFEQKGEGFHMQEVSATTGARDIVYMPPSVMMSLVTEWGPCWTEAEMSLLVKVSSSGWEPYLIMRQLFC